MKFVPGSPAEWEETLRLYLDVSDEDDKVVGFIETIVPAIRDHLDMAALEWLEVGPGPGRKTMQILNSLRSEAGFDTVSLDILEPSDFWQAEIERFDEDGRVDQTIGERFQHFGAARMASYGLISFIHVLHDQGDTEELVEVLRGLRDVGGKHVVVVVTESESSDLFQIRQRLAQASLIPIWGAPVRRLAVLLQEQGFRFDAATIEPEVCRLSGDETEDAWLYPFLLATSVAKYRKMAREQREHVEAVVGKYLHTLSTGVLQVPDVGFSIYLP